MSLPDFLAFAPYGSISRYRTYAEIPVTPKITDGHKLLALNARRWRELRGIETEALANSLGWPLAMIEDIEAAERFDLTLNDIGQLAEILGIQAVELFLPTGRG